MWKCVATLSQLKVNLDCIYITMNSEIYVDKNENGSETSLCLFASGRTMQ